MNFLRDAFKKKKKKTYLRTLSQLGLTPPPPSHFGTSTIGTFELGFGPPPNYCYDELAARGYRGPKWGQKNTTDAGRPLRWREVNDRTNGFTKNIV